MVHAAGRQHRPDFDRLKGLDQLIEELKRNWKSSSRSKPFELPTFFERVWGGEYDGPPDDIINYHSKGKDPDKVKLYDRPLFDSAFFVKTP
jgi:hypothetical protein